MYARIINLLFLVSVIALFATGLADSAFAQEATSSSFIMSNANINTFGGSSTSTSFSSDASGNQLGGGESTSTSFLMKAGFQYSGSFTPMEQKWRWYDDETNETPTSPLAGEDVAPSSVDNLNIVKLRVSVAEVGGVNGTNVKFSLQFATSSDFSGTVSPVAETGDCTGTSGFCYANGAGVDNAVISTKLLSDADVCTSGVGQGCGTHNESGTTTSSYTQQASSTAEYEFTIKESGADINTVYFFRLVDNGTGLPVPLNAGQSYPSLASQSSTLSFTIGGVASSTVTSGVTTDIDTTSTSVPFGSLLSNSSVSGAQRLTVTTNGGQGYSIYSYASQGFLGSNAEEIPPVSGTNSSPVGWNTGCDISFAGCFGYHTNEAVLSGGSTRFAADDTYAQFETAPREVDFSSGATTSKSTDIVYKLQVRPLLESDSYSTSVTYIVVPIF